jgi:hypothetical protein
MPTQMFLLTESKSHDNGPPLYLHYIAWDLNEVQKSQSERVGQRNGTGEREKPNIMSLAPVEVILVRVWEVGWLGFRLDTIENETRWEDFISYPVALWLSVVMDFTNHINFPLFLNFIDALIEI